MAGVYNRSFSPDKWDNVNKKNKDIIDDYITELKARKKADGTIKQYYNDLRIVAIYVLEKLDNRSLLELTRKDFRNFVINCQDEWGLGSARINRLLAAIHTILSFCEDDDETYEDYTRNASEKVKGLPKADIRETVFIANDVIMKLYDKFIEEERFMEATLLGLLYDSGCRRNEIAQVRRSDIKSDGNKTHKVKGKRGKMFSVLYFDMTKNAFEKYNATRTDDSDELFVEKDGRVISYERIYDIIKKWPKELNEIDPSNDYSDMNVHTFRHCYIENMVNGTHYLCDARGLGPVPIEKVKVLVHHESSDTTLGYTKNDEDKDIEDFFGISM